MKKIIICLLAALALVACKKSDGNEAATGANAEGQTPRNELPTASPDDPGQEEWTKQTTIMSSKPMVIDFYADWCGPCKQQAPILNEIEMKYKGTVIFKRVNVDEEPELAQEFRVEAIPMLMFVAPNGDYQSIMGLHEAPDIEEMIGKLLKHSSK